MQTDKLSNGMTNSGTQTHLVRFISTQFHRERHYLVSHTTGKFVYVVQHDKINSQRSLAAHSKNKNSTNPLINTRGEPPTRIRL